MDRTTFCCKNHVIWIRFLKGLAVASVSMMTAMGCGALAHDQAIDEPYGGSPQAVENPCDLDSDGHLSLACGGDDCDDTAAAIHPGAIEQCDDLDNDCNRMTDDNCVSSIGGAPDPCTKISCRWP